VLIFILGVLSPQDAGVEFFEKKIRPVLVEKCYKCHSTQAAKEKGGLLLDTREGVLKGGESGPAVVPGHPEKSLLIRAIKHADESLSMPAKEKLPDDQIADFVAWVKIGAPDPRTVPAVPASSASTFDFVAARRFRSFQPPIDRAVPEVRSKPWVRNDIDRFVAARLEEKGLLPSPLADKRTLIRRLSYDLVGLPPTPQEVDAYLADGSADAYEKLVERLLGSVHFGERWGRHWLDVARYADTKEWVVAEERRLAYAYTYRDWVIRAFNEDLPFDRFVTLQLAADRVAADRRDLAALGFLTVGRSFLNRLPDIIDDRIDVVTRGLLGLSASCARCHDHKYDPIPTKDYYSLYGIFASTTTPKELPLLGAPPRTPEYAAFEKELLAKEGEMNKFRQERHAAILAPLRTPEKIAEYLLAGQEALGKGDDELRSFGQQRKLNRAMLRRWRDFLRKTSEAPHPVLAAWHAYAGLPAASFADASPAALAGLKDLNPVVAAAFAEPPGSLREAADRYGVLIADPRDEALRQAAHGPDGVLNLPPADADMLLQDGDRDKLRKLKQAVDALHNHPGAPPRAMSLEDAAAPQNARVFIRGNAGSPGEEVPRAFLTVLCPEERAAVKAGSGRLELARAIASPDNPLTARVFVNRVWAWLFGRGIVATPSDFGARGEPPTHPELLDWLARRFVAQSWSVKTLVRQIVLSSTYRQSSAANSEGLAGDPQNRYLWRMNRRRMDFEAMRDALLEVAGRPDRAVGGRPVPLTEEPFSRRRSVYGHVDRLNLANVLRVFDFAGPDMHVPQRYTTTVPQQALFLMNSPFVLEQARQVTARPEVAAEADPEQRLQRLYRAVFGRAATAREAGLGLAFVAGQEAGPLSPWEKLAHVLLQSNEFMFVD